MSLPPTLPVSDVVVVNVSVASGAVAPRPFNQGLLVGSSPVIPTYGANPRLRQYPSLAAMLTDGFTNNEPEYLAASLYFAQPGPPQFVWIGRQDLTAIKTAIPHSGNAGTGYVVGDVIGVTQGGATNGLLTVLTIGMSGVVTSLGTTIGNQGTGYTVANGLTTTGGTGTGLEVDITAVGETPLQAVEACSLVNQQWYPFMVCGASDADHLALSLFSTANWETALYVGSSSTSSIPAGTTGNLFLEAQAANYKALLTYNTTQSGEFPTNIYAAAAICGAACGLNTGAPNSAFTLNLKKLAGVAPEPLTQTQYNNIINANGNTCVSYGPYIGYLVTGILSSGDFFDQILNRSTLVNKIQTNVMNVLVSTTKVPQTNPGEQLLIAAVEQACQDEVIIGYLAPGVWEGASIQLASSGVVLANGQSLPQGFGAWAPPYSTQSSGDRAARKAMPITCAILEAGAVHSVVINVLTQL